MSLAPPGLHDDALRTKDVGRPRLAPLDAQHGGDRRPADRAVPRLPRGERLPALKTDAAVAALHDDRVFPGDAAHVAYAAHAAYAAHTGHAAHTAYAAHATCAVHISYTICMLICCTSNICCTYRTYAYLIGESYSSMLLKEESSRNIFQYAARRCCVLCYQTLLHLSILLH